MRHTPELPSRIRDFAFSGYTNVHSFLKTCPRLYGTETMPGFGDWDASVLLLAKDGAPTQVIRSLAQREGDGAWRHAQRERGDPGGFKSNERLVELASVIPGTKLYGSATANMLYDDPRWSRSLPGFYSGPLHDHLAYVLGWVITSMPNLRVIACLGSNSWYLTTHVLGISHVSRQSDAYRDGSRQVAGQFAGRSILATSHYHPAARVSNDRMASGWSALRTLVAR